MMKHLDYVKLRIYIYIVEANMLLEGHHEIKFHLKYIQAIILLQYTIGYYDTIYTTNGVTGDALCANQETIIIIVVVVALRTDW